MRESVNVIRTILSSRGYDDLRLSLPNELRPKSKVSGKNIVVGKVVAVNSFYIAHMWTIFYLL